MHTYSYFLVLFSLYYLLICIMVKKELIQNTYYIFFIQHIYFFYIYLIYYLIKNCSKILKDFGAVFYTFIYFHVVLQNLFPLLQLNSYFQLVHLFLLELLSCYILLHLKLLLFPHNYHFLANYLNIHLIVLFL